MYLENLGRIKDRYLYTFGLLYTKTDFVDSNLLKTTFSLVRLNCISKKRVFIMRPLTYFWFYFPIRFHLFYDDLLRKLLGKLPFFNLFSVLLYFFFITFFNYFILVGMDLKI